jgi:hypothetical protein
MRFRLSGFRILPGETFASAEKDDVPALKDEIRVRNPFSRVV